MKQITIKDAHLHNLKNLDISIPKNKLVVATGVSGSGKSSLIFDIIFEEGRRQYLQSLGVFTGEDEEQKFESISGIGPTIAVKQNIIRQANPRSTVGSRTGLLNTLATIFAKEGKIACRSCGEITNADLICETCKNIEERYPIGYFSYNNPNGMCLTCSGRGIHHEIDMEKLVPNPKLILDEIFDKIQVTAGLRGVLNRHFGDFLNVSYEDIPDDVKSEILFGRFINSNASKRTVCITRILEGHIQKYGKDPTEIYNLKRCPDCNGFRIGDEARNVFLNNKHIGELSCLSLAELNEFFIQLLASNEISDSSKKACQNLQTKLAFFIKARLGHLSLYREISSLSGGEMQRLFLATHLHSEMDSLIYVLDEPTSGLHEFEKPELINFVSHLKELGNSVIVVEHDKTMINQAEHVIDLGPGAGIEGGELIYQGDLKGLLNCETSVTGQYLSKKKTIEPRKKITISKDSPFIKIFKANTNNLKNINVSFPLGSLVGIAGLSGSGKSSLISNTLIPLIKQSFANNLNNSDYLQEDFFETNAEKIVGVFNISGFAEVSQKPIGRNSNSNPVTYVGVWDKIRKVFSKQPTAKQKGLTQGDFSFNSTGACQSCSGAGVNKVWLGGSMFLSNTCSECHGKRFNQDSLSITYNGKNIHEVLQMSISEAVEFFHKEKSICSPLKIIKQIGMGYIKLGQSTPTLSGGEAQRIKLAKEIARKRKGNILYVFDEPTSGLSMHDTAKLIQLMDELVKKGNSVIVIEHDPHVLSACDWIIELGPEGGVNGGTLIAEGTPEELKKNPNSKTGRYLE